MWDDSEHLLLLQEKLNSYLAFIESGEIYESYPRAMGRQLVIDLVLKHSPSVEGFGTSSWRRSSLSEPAPSCGIALCGATTPNNGLQLTARSHASQVIWFRAA